MATTTAMNKWTEELAASLLPANLPPSKSRRVKSQFIRSVRHHNYARTNQFEVEERLTGLELKFQVLDHDDLSDALHERRTELLEHQQQWVPDVLDFLLRMSKHPISARGLDALSHVVEDDLVTPQLKWADIEKDDPIDRRDQMWRQPDYSDFSSDDDLIESSAATSPASVKQKPQQGGADGTPPPVWAHANAIDLDTNLNKIRLDTAGGSKQVFTEIQIIREMLFMLQGLPTKMFTMDSGQLRRHPSIHISHMSTRALDSVLSRGINISKAASAVRRWSFSGSSTPFVEALEDTVAAVVRAFDTFLSDCHEATIQAQSRGGVCSLMSTIEEVYQRAPPILATAQFLRAATDQDSIGLLELLFELTGRAEQTGQTKAFETLSPILRDVLSIFMCPVCEWVEDGVLKEGNDTFFVEKVVDQHDKAKLWHGWFTCSLHGRRRLPMFLSSLSERIFIAGKTAAFVRTLGQNVAHAAGKTVSLSEGIKAARAGTSNTILPFGPSLVSSIELYVDHHLTASTSSLQAALEQRCKMAETLSALSHIYLSESPYATSVIDAEIFTRLDRARRSWNDRFLVCDTIDEACSTIAAVEVGRISVESQQMPSSQLYQARTTVKVLENLAIDYKLPWHIANIISVDSFASYRRISLLLTQIRRAKYVLERHAFLTLRKHEQHHHPTSNSSSLSSTSATAAAELTCTTLLLFINTLHSHLTHCVIGPLTARMRSRLTATAPGTTSSSSKTTTTTTTPSVTTVTTVDEMIATHKSYTDAMERCCLLTKNLKMVRDTLLSLLDLCVGFGFQVLEADANANPSAKATFIDDFALSKTKTQFRKLMNLFVAGLRGAARAGSGSGSGSASRQQAAAAATTTTTTAGGGGSGSGSGGAVGARGDRELGFGNVGDLIDLLADSLESARLKM